MSDHPSTVDPIPAYRTGSHAARRTLPSASDRCHPGALTGGYRSHLGTILADADLAIARRDWLDELLDDVIASGRRA